MSVNICAFSTFILSLSLFVEDFFPAASFCKQKCPIGEVLSGEESGGEREEVQSIEIPHTSYFLTPNLIPQPHSSYLITGDN